MIGRSGFDLADQIWGSDAGFQAEQNMRVIGHAIDRNQFLPFSRYDSGYVFL